MVAAGSDGGVGGVEGDGGGDGDVSGVEYGGGGKLPTQHSHIHTLSQELCGYRGRGAGQLGLGLRRLLTEEAMGAVAVVKVAEEGLVAVVSAADVRAEAEWVTVGVDAFHRWEACRRYGQRPASSCRSSRDCRPPG